MEFLCSFLRRHLARGGGGTSGRVTKCWLFSQASNISACKLKPHPHLIPYFFTPPFKKTSIFVTYSWIIPWFLKWRGEVWILKAIAQYGCFSCLWYWWCLWYWSLNFKLSPGFLPCLTKNKSTISLRTPCKIKAIIFNTVFLKFSFTICVAAILPVTLIYCTVF